ncbi:GmrSD restriction endonuclease domain-containing protein [Arthrobacter sp. USHLN218]|uniref:GmrSD restriction endonuclease domain-containing protein n=1 Tax=Arthrobacter sp. USHLN218 TaxID=3081232 RepID=UPI00301A4A9F
MKLSTVLDQIDSQDVALPEFQRGYVWNRQQVRGLFTSLYKGYPIGGFMTWNTSVTSVKPRGGGIERDGSVKLLLDGQQRATTLYGVIRGNPPRFFEGNAQAFKDLYFNVQDETFEFYAPVKMKDNPAWIDVSGLMVQGVEKYLEGHPEISQLGAGELVKVMARMTRLTEIQNREVHIEEVSGADKTIDVVVDIFNRVNSGGTKLSKGDLALAKICAAWPEAREKMNKYRQKWESAGYKFTLDWLLRNVNAILTGEALFTALASVEEETIRKGLKETADLVSIVLDVIAARLGLDFDRVFPARFAVPVIARYMHRNGDKFPNAVERDRILTWYLHAAMWGRFAGSTESFLNVDLKAVDEAGIDGLMEQMRRFRGDLIVREADFGGNTVGARFYPMLYMLTRTQGAKDFTTGIPLSAHMLGKNSSLQVHHIFPKARLYEAGYSKEEVNAVANYCFLTQDANLAITDRDPAEYFRAIERDFPGALASQWIPTDQSLWSIDRYRDFLAARRQLLADAMNSVLDELWHGTSTADLERTVPAEGTPAGASLEIEQLVQELTDMGLSSGETGIEVRNQESGDLVCVAEAFWADGLQPGMSTPVVLELDGNADELNELARLGYLVFTDIAAVRQHAEDLLLEVPN